MSDTQGQKNAWDALREENATLRARLAAIEATPESKIEDWLDEYRDAAIEDAAGTVNPDGSITFDASSRTVAAREWLLNAYRNRGLRLARLKRIVRRYIRVRRFEVVWVGEVDRLDHEWRRYTPREREDPLLQHIVHPLLMAARHAARKMRQARRLGKELLAALALASEEATIGARRD